MEPVGVLVWRDEEQDPAVWICASPDAKQATGTTANAAILAWEAMTGRVAWPTYSSADAPHQSPAAWVARG